jgi:hypothetical protein
MGTRFIYAECSVIKYRGGTVVLYPLAKHQPEVKPLHSKKSACNNNRRITSKHHINQYENQSSFTTAVENEDLAAVIVEPVVGVAGCIPAQRDFLKGLRELADEKGFLLIFDEVIAGFRFYKGAQKLLRREAGHSNGRESCWRAVFRWRGSYSGFFRVSRTHESGGKA